MTFLLLSYITIMGTYKLLILPHHLSNALDFFSNILTVGLPEIWNILEIRKMKNCSKVQFLMGKMNVHKSADHWDNQFFQFWQKFQDQSFFPNCEKTELGTTFLKISLDLAYSLDSKKGLAFENLKFNSWLISKTVFD